MTTNKNPSKQPRGQPKDDQENRDQKAGQREQTSGEGKGDKSTSDRDDRADRGDQSAPDDRDADLGEHGILSDDREVE
jgi:hypothetical protein